MTDIDEIFAALRRSAFRRRFRLGIREGNYLRAKGLPLVLAHAKVFIDKRLSQALPLNDGKQTPFRGHPVFIAQHATATCCRRCLSKWHGIAPDKELLPEEKDHIVAVIERWLKQQSGMGSKEELHRP